MYYSCVCPKDEYIYNALTQSIHECSMTLRKHYGYLKKIAYGAVNTGNGNLREGMRV